MVFHPAIHQPEHARLSVKVSKALPISELDHKCLCPKVELNMREGTNTMYTESKKWIIKPKLGRTTKTPGFRSLQVQTYVSIHVLHHFTGQELFWY